MSGSARKRLARGQLLVRFDCDMEFTAPFHVGCGEKSSTVTDAPFLRDANGQPWLPGSSVRGVLRSYCEREALLLRMGHDTVMNLFGESTAEGSRRGRLTVLAARPVTKDDSVAEVRDHVSMERKWGAAKGTGKFDQEVAYSDRLKMTLLYEGDREQDPELILLEAGLAALKDRVLAFGGKTGWGLGEPRATAIRRTVTGRGSPEGLAAYIGSRLHPSTSSEWIPKPSYPGVSKLPPWPAPMPRSWLRLDLAVQFDGPMLVGGMFQNSEPNAEPADRTTKALRSTADAIYQATPKGKAILAGSSLRGALQARARQIADTVGGEAMSIPDVLFGTIKQGNGKDEGNKGLLRVGEGCLQGDPAPIRMDHVAIDRVTGFTRTGAKFDTVGLQSPRFNCGIFVMWDLRCREHKAAVTLLLLALRELEEGLLWLGSRTSRGYGKVGSVSLELLTASPIVDAEAGWKRTYATLAKPGTVRGLGSSAKDLLHEALDSWESMASAAASAAGGAK